MTLGRSPVSGARRAPPARRSPRLLRAALAGVAGTAAFTAFAAVCLMSLAPGAAYAQLRLPGASQAPAQAPDARSTATRPGDYIVAVVNSEPITNNEVRTRVARILDDLARRGQAAPPREALARQVLDRLISERAQLQLARESGLRIDDATVDAAEQNVARQNQISVTELRRRLSAEGISQSSFREDLRNQLLLSRLREREIEPRVRISEAELDQFIREQKTSTDASSLELSLGHILVAVPEDASPSLTQELRAKAQRIQARARAGEDFAALAREFSDAPNAAASGGMLGARSADELPPLFVQATRELAPGGVAELVRSGAGFHVLKLVDKRSGALPGATVTQTHARHILLRPGPRLSEAQARARLADYKRRIESGQADFAQLAREFSQDGSARQGGDLGWSSPGAFVPEFDEALEALAPGQISDPVTTRFGVHLIQLQERRVQALTEREQREIARNLLREKKLEETYARWAQDVRGRAWVELREPPQ